MASKHYLEKSTSTAHHSKSKRIGAGVKERAIYPLKTKPRAWKFLDCLYGFVSFSFMTNPCKIKCDWHIDREAEPKREHCEKVK